MKEGSEELEEQVSALQAEPRGSAHQDERAAQQEDSGGHDGRSQERFTAAASSAAADGRKRAQHCQEADPQPSRLAGLPLPCPAHVLGNSRMQRKQCLPLHLCAELGACEAQHIIALFGPIGNPCASWTIWSPCRQNHLGGGICLARCLCEA